MEHPDERLAHLWYLQGFEDACSRSSMLPYPPAGIYAFPFMQGFVDCVDAGVYVMRHSATGHGHPAGVIF